MAVKTTAGEVLLKYKFPVSTTSPHCQQCHRLLLDDADDGVEWDKARSTT